MKFKKKQRNKAPSFLYIVPLVNVVFLLLFFFVIMPSLSLKPMAKLPGPSPVKGAAAAASLAVMPGKLILDGKQVQAQAVSALPRDRKIIITVSPDVTYVHLSDILDALRSSGHTDISLTTRPIHN